MKVEFDERRWYVRIIVRDDDGQIISEHVASADGELTDGSGIWFGTAEEYEQATEDLW